MLVGSLSPQNIKVYNTTYIKHSGAFFQKLMLLHTIVSFCSLVYFYTSQSRNIDKSNFL